MRAVDDDVERVDAGSVAGKVADGTLLAVAYAWEQATRLRKPPTLVGRGLLPVTPARELN